MFRLLPVLARDRQQPWQGPSVTLTHHGMHGFKADPMPLIAAGAKVGEAAA